MGDKIDGAIAVAIDIARDPYLPFPSPIPPNAKLEFRKISFVD